MRDWILEGGRGMVWRLAWIFASVLFFLPWSAAEAGSGQAPPAITAEAAILVEASTGRVLYEKNADRLMYPASMTKIMTCLLALEHGHLEAPVTVSETAADTEYAELSAQDRLTMEELLTEINPKRPDDAYPDKDLAGVGLSYKLAAALLSARPVPGVRAEDWLDFVAIGTICDMVPLRGENRDLARAGLELLRKSSRPCIVALAQVSGVEVPKIDSQSIGFSFGPRLNAAGRLETAMLSFNLMMSADKDEAIRFAEELNVINRQRQAMTEEIQQSIYSDRKSVV